LAASVTTPLSLGFLTVLHENAGYLGGYLVTNQWGRPLEFRLSTAVQPNRVQQILYGETLLSYICGDLIGKTLIDKTGTVAQLLVTDTQAALDLRLRVETPVFWLAPPEAPGPDPTRVCQLPGGRGTLHVHTLYPSDIDVGRQQLEPLCAMLDLGEPFSRIREAMTEARKLGVTNRG
jgi:hypothetical protein